MNQGIFGGGVVKQSSGQFQLPWPWSPLCSPCMPPVYTPALCTLDLGGFTETQSSCISLPIFHTGLLCSANKNMPTALRNSPFFYLSFPERSHRKFSYVIKSVLTEQSQCRRKGPNSLPTGPESYISCLRESLRGRV